MGTFLHPITITGPSGQSETLEALVDTGVMFAVIPAGVLRRLGVKPERSISHRGEERGFGQVEGKLMGHPGCVTYIVGKRGERARIGSHTLDSFLLDADEEGGKLRPKTLRLVQHF
jgi:hypothetical protein